MLVEHEDCGVSDGNEDPMELVENDSRLILSRLPADGLNMVLSFLVFSDLKRLACTSRSMQDAVSSTSHLFMEEAYSHMTPTSPQVRFDDKGLRRFLERFANLTVLQLSGLAAVGDQLFHVLNNCKAAQTIQVLSLHDVNLTYWCHPSLDLLQLKSLRISGGSIRSSLGAIFSKSTQLQCLHISQCPSLRDDQMAASLLHLSGSLRKLSFTQCLRVKQPILQFSYLQELSLMGCFALTDLPHFNCPCLEVLDLSFCFRITSDKLSAVIESCAGTLTELNLVKCTALDSLILPRDLQRLRVLNCSYCDYLHFLKIANGKSLQKLEMNCCSRLETFLLDNAINLLQLDLHSLPIRRLEVYAAQLRKLNLEGCRQLSNCIVHCPSLKVANVRDCRVVALRFCKEVREVVISNWTRNPLQVDAEFVSSL